MIELVDYTGEVPSSIPNLDDCNHEDNPFATSSFANEADSIKGTLLVPCRTAMQGSFPLNGTYFQVNEVPISLNSCRFLFLQITKRDQMRSQDEKSTQGKKAGDRISFLT
jgi:hypothetical protein